MYKAPGQGKTINPLGTNVDVNRKPLSLCPFVASYMYIHIDKGIQLLGGQTFDVNRKPLTLAHSLQVLKKGNLNLYTFAMIIYIYIPGARAENPLGTNL